MAPRPTTPTIVTLYPTGSARILGDPVVGTPPEVITEAGPEAAAILLSYRPAAFYDSPTPFSATLAGVPRNTITTSGPLEATPPPPGPAPVVDAPKQPEEKPTTG